MSPIVILLIGMTIVIGGILWLRLHAFVALIVAALLCAYLTPTINVLNNEQRTYGIAIATINDDGTVVVKPTKKQKIIEGRVHLLRSPEEGGFQQVATGSIAVKGKSDAGTTLAITFADNGIAVAKGDRIMHHTQLSAAKSKSERNFGERAAIGFGDTCGKIGIVIAMAAIIGICLMESGAAERIVLSIQKLLGEKRTPLAFAGSGFILGTPVFFDTVFYLMIPLGKAMRARTGRNYLLYVLTIVCGATMAHSLVPPTPGPLLVAEMLDVDLGQMIMGGTIVGLFAATAGFLFATWANKRWEIPLRESAELSKEDLEAMVNRDESTLPPLTLSLLPILLPVVLIAGGTAAKMTMDNMGDAVPTWVVRATPFLDVVGNKNIALSIAAGIALLLLGFRKGMTRQKLATSVQHALASGGIIILITAGGGAFGQILQQTDIAATIGDMVPATQVGLLPLAFIICTAIRTAQGSATVAMITTAPIVLNLVGSEPLSYSPLYLACAIGCGSKPISWMNDSGFWVISKMSGLTEGEMLKTNTIMGLIMGTVGLLITMLGAWLLPLV